MSPWKRLGLCMALLTSGLGAQAALERMTEAPRPRLRQSLSALPLSLGHWAGRDEPMDPLVLEKAQATDHLNRVYQDTRHPGRRVGLWINYSIHGLNLRHTPELCLPAGGWKKIESQSRVVEAEGPAGDRLPISRLVYAKDQGELVQGIGFWYYIFGEGRLERLVRRLPITSRSSHGRATRGSGLTVEVFCPGQSDPDGQVLQEFARELLAALEPLLPGDRAQYYIP